MNEAVVKRDSLTISEVELFKAVDLWAAKECERQGMSTDGSAKRSILGESIVKEIRFPLMKKEEFATIVPDSRILTSLEAKNIMSNFNSVYQHQSVSKETKELAHVNHVFGIAMLWKGC